MKSALSVYDADKTGMVDYALESAGENYIFFIIKIFTLLI